MMTIAVLGSSGIF